MKTIVEQPYDAGMGFTGYPVMSYDEDANIDEREFTRIGTMYVRDGVAPGDILDALNNHFSEGTPKGDEVIVTCGTDLSRNVKEYRVRDKGKIIYRSIIAANVISWLEENGLEPCQKSKEKFAWLKNNFSGSL